MNYKMTKKEAKDLISNKLSHFFGVTPEEATYEHYYKAIALILRDMMMQGRKEFHNESKTADSKKVYYLCVYFGNFAHITDISLLAVNFCVHFFALYEIAVKTAKTDCLTTCVV